MDSIKDRIQKGYTMAIYGTREATHEQMVNDIETLLRMLNMANVRNEVYSEVWVKWAELSSYEFGK